MKKVFLLLFVSFCFGFIGLVLWAGFAHAQPLPFPPSGGLPGCQADLTTCSGDLGTCNTTLGVCVSDLGTSNTNLGVCVSDLGTCNTIVGDCTDAFTTCNTDLTQAQGDLSTCNDDLADCQAQSICGDGIVEGTEDCDVGNLNGATCSTEGFLGGILACATGCTFDTNGCFVTRFVDNGDGTVTDNQTGKMWEKKVEGSGCLHCVNDQYDWNTAMSDWISEVNGHTNDPTGSAQSGLGGYTDWRIQTLAELLTIFDLSEGFCGGGVFLEPCINPIFGPTAASAYWSASTNAADPGHAWFVSFSTGLVFDVPKSFSNRVRAVRNSP